MVPYPNSPIACHDNRVSVIGGGRVGSTLVQRIAEKNLADVVLLDIKPGMPQGIALDLMEARGIEGHDCQIIGTNDYADTAGSDVVVITAGSPRKPGMSRDDLLQINSKIVVEAAKNAIAKSPDAMIIVVTNPLDVMTYLAWQATDLPPHRVMGMAGVLDSTRFRTFIAMENGVSVADVNAVVLGGHGDLMVPLPRYSTVSGVPITELMTPDRIEALIERTRRGGAEIVELMRTGSAYFAPASSACLMVQAILHNQSRQITAAAYLQGEYDLEDIFIGVPTRLGCRGIEKILELKLTDYELSSLKISAESVRDNIKKAQGMLGH
ncbi:MULTISPECIES: malate dehydrogenase [unclassified Moorena]|uniref:malate dehydrogenase n=1 Tax=unclassified Moorena TaxID=2683338 RepID=UPI0014011563|nr:MULTISPECIES: malate dehydrogenase [unclassified Moorena]NEO14688.1 malate dehydrogenase [Moorena sp. SIO3E8]NEP98887.1 malate dehydrogenase [Moorena sp. SIO3F7]